MAIVSGGLDSTSMLWHLVSEGFDVIEILTFDYGQRHVKEIEAAEKIVKEFGNYAGKSVPHSIVDLKSLRAILAKGALTGDEEVPKEMYDKESQRATIVPNRNAIMLSIAVGRAVTVGARYVAYAAHSSDYSVYPDCRPEFIEAMDKAMYLANLWTPVNLLAPFQHITKAEVTSIGLRLNAPLHLTWSCYVGGARPCLECGTCLERTEAFKLNGSPDPALTPDEWVQALSLYEQHSADSK